MKLLSRLSALVLLCLAVSATPARADGFISPFLGFNFGGDSANCLGLSTCEDHRNNWGVSLGTMGSVFGFEADIGYAPQFFGKLQSGDNAVLTVMSNLLLIIPAGPIRPYGVVGVGWIQQKVTTVTGVGDFSQDSFAGDVGGGLMVYFANRIGVLIDYRYFQNFHATSANIIGVPTDHFSFNRASIGVLFRF